MKKTRIVGLLLVFVLVTSCFVGGTFAKYASKGTAKDTATVAKWSIIVNDTEIATTGSHDEIKFDLFATANELDGTVITNTKDENVKENGNIIAPGTCGQFDLEIKNLSEVTAKYIITLSHENTSNIPLEYSLDNNTWNSDISQITISNNNITMETGEKTETVYWRWQFNDVTNLKDDASDTKLGIAAQGTAPKVTVTATITVEQVD